MTILFTASLTKDQQEDLLETYPKQTFIFKEDINKLNDHLPEATVIVTFGEDLDDETIKQAKKLKWIMVMSAGLDQMPFKAIEERGILVTNVSGIHKTTMAEYALSMLLYVLRHEKQITQNKANSKWDSSLHMGEIVGQTMLVVGAGSIGQEVARIAKAFQMTTLGLSRSGRKVDFFDENHSITEKQDVLPRADFIVSVLPSTDETKDMYGMAEFKQMKDTAIFLNMGRGDAVVEEDLLQAIEQQVISHAVLDVFKQEPLPEDHPFWSEENITITPHIAAKSDHYMSRALTIFQQNFDAFIEDKNDYVNIIDSSQGY